MSNLSKTAVNQILKSPFGEALVEAFQRLEVEMEMTGGTDFFAQVGFNKPGEPVEPGELIPTLHMSLRPNDPILSQPVELVWDEEISGEPNDNQ